MQVIGLTAPEEGWDLLRNGERRDRSGRDGPGQDMDVLAFKSVKLPTQLEIKNSKIQKSKNICQFPNFPGRGLSPRHGPGRRLL